MLEIGTGSGCLSITLARLFLQWKIHACDIIGAALRVARNNASLHRCRARLRFHRGDLFDGHFLTNEAFEVIISNPPYISDEERPQYDRSILYEPSMALFVRPPLKYYAEIIRRVRQGWLKTRGHLIFECSPFNVEAIKALFIAQDHHFDHPQVRLDTNGLPRVISARKLAGFNLNSTLKVSTPS